MPTPDAGRTYAQLTGPVRYDVFVSCKLHTPSIQHQPTCYPGQVNLTWSHMSTPVVTDKWTGDLECSACRRKRRPASEFSKKAMERYRANPGSPLNCKLCVDKAAIAERTSASNAAADTDAVHDCSVCTKSLPASSFTRNQFNKGLKAKCSACTAAAALEEASASEANKEKKMADAFEAVALAEKSGNAMDKLRTTSQLAALQAEHVTGLKPVKMGGRDRGRGRGGRGSR